MLFTLIVTDTASVLQAKPAPVWAFFTLGSSGVLGISAPLSTFALSFRGKWLSGQIPFFQKEELSRQ